ncbi:MAG: MopE-related protein [Myxococcota bacterium]
MQHRWAWIAVAAWSGCRPEAPVDADGDGFDVDIDCDDDDPAVHPDAEEAPFDPVDQNCDTGDDASLSFARIAYSQSGTGIAGPRFASTADHVQVNLVFANDGLNDSAWAMERWGADSARFVTDDQRVLVDDENPLQSGRAFDAALRPDVDAILAIGFAFDGFLRASVAQLYPNGGWRWAGFGPNDTTAPFADLAIHDDGERLSVAACGEHGLYWLSGTVPAFDAFTEEVAYDGAVGVGCEVVGPEVRQLDAGGAVTAYTIDGDAMVAGQTWSGIADFQWTEDGMLTVGADGLAFDTGAAVFPIDTAEPAVRARFDIDGDTLFVVYATAAGALHLAYGALGEPFTDVALGDDLARTDLDVEVTPATLFVAARSADDAWVAGVVRPGR